MGTSWYVIVALYAARLHHLEPLKPKATPCRMEVGYIPM